MDGVELVGFNRSLFIHGFAGHIEHTSHDTFTDGHGDGFAEVEDLLAALESLGGAHGDRTNPAVTEVLLDLESQLCGAASGRGEVDGQRVVDRGELPREFHVHDRTDDLDDFAFIHR